MRHPIPPRWTDNPVHDAAAWDRYQEELEKYKKFIDSEDALFDADDDERGTELWQR